jgi:hypothetical protein
MNWGMIKGLTLSGIVWQLPQFSLIEGRSLGLVATRLKEHRRGLAVRPKVG